MEELRADPPPHVDVEAEAIRLASAASELGEGRLRPVINATGVVLQTNLGRAPVSEDAMRAVNQLGGYLDLEYDLVPGRRGERSTRLGATLEALLGVPGMVVNNNASSLLLCLFALARGREVVVSRGELVEIGGSFRLPDVMRLSGARLVEVGTTNRTRLSDYAEAITARTGLLLKVHASNFRVVGFTESAPLAELAALARDRGVTLLEDLGSGALLDTAGGGLGHEPTVQESLAAGVDLVCFSGDKLLGGPQAGIIAGRTELVTRLRRSPLYRALRPDKLTLAVLQATLATYVRGTAETELPLWRMLRMPAGETRARAAGWARALGDATACEVVDVESPVGGGSLPEQVLLGAGLAISPPGRGSADHLARRLRTGEPAVVGRVAEGRVVLDPRTVPPALDDALLRAVRAALA
ncbi:MAG: L-seryl-tRNA(Sec) selenium transferase [Candidatus Dormibacteraeota bacterium]|nr:L-seryl-tRNA(Sec) selenium transferase [Candidatus Dormibacteraeota bacterium]